MRTPEKASTSDQHDSAATRQALSRVLASEAFTDVPRLSRFLEYVVEEFLDGRGDRLKGVVIALEVFDKKTPSEAQSTTVVRVEAGRLRRRLTDYYNNEGKNDPLRISIPKGGYKPVIEPKQTTEDKRAEPLGEAKPEEPASGPGAQSSSQRGISRPAWAILALIVVIGFTYALLSEWPLKTASGPTADIAPVIAVLPFENFQEGGGHPGFGLEIAESLIATLSKQPNLHVMSLSSTEYFRSKMLSVKDIARDVQASHVIRGGYSRSMENTHFTVSLHDTSTGYVLWSDDFYRDNNASEAGIVNQILAGLTAQLGLEFTGPTPSTLKLDTDRYTLYRQARDLTHPPDNPMRVDLALTIFEALINEYPDFAAAFAGAAYASSAKVWWRHSKQPEEDGRNARYYAHRALELDKHTGLAYLATGLLQMHAGDRDEAVLHLQRAVNVQPSNSLASSVLGMFKLWAGSPEGSVPLIETAIRLDPFNTRAPYWNILGTVQFHLGNYPQAVAAFKTNLTQGGPRSTSFNYYLAASLVGSGRMEEARNTLLEDESNANSPGWQRFIYQNFRDKSEFDHLLAKLEPLGVMRSPALPAY